MSADGVDPPSHARPGADGPGVAAEMQRTDHASRGAGLVIQEFRPGWARVALTVDERHLNGHGTCHGGYLFLLADTALAYASNGHGLPAVTAGADIVLLRPVLRGAQAVAEAVERAVSGRSGLYDVTIRVDGRVVAEVRGRTRQVRATAPR